MENLGSNLEFLDHCNNRNFVYETFYTEKQTWKPSNQRVSLRPSTSTAIVILLFIYLIGRNENYTTKYLLICNLLIVSFLIMGHSEIFYIVFL